MTNLSMSNYKQFLENEVLIRVQNAGLTSYTELYNQWINDILVTIYQTEETTDNKTNYVIHFFFSNDIQDTPVTIKTTSESKTEGNIYLKLNTNNLPDFINERIIKNGVCKEVNKNVKSVNCYLQRLLVALDQDILKLYIHHLDKDTLNNSRDNLLALAWPEHAEIHPERKMKKLNPFRKNVVDSFIKAQKNNLDITIETFCKNYNDLNENNSLTVTTKQLNQWIKASDEVVITDQTRKDFISKYEQIKVTESKLTQKQFCEDNPLNRTIISEKNFSEWKKQFSETSSLNITKKSTAPITRFTKIDDYTIIQILIDNYLSIKSESKINYTTIAKKYTCALNTVKKYINLNPRFKNYYEGENVVT